MTSNEKKAEKSHLLDVFKNTTITIPLTNAIQYIPTYGKFVTELCSSSRKKRIKLFENVSSFILHSLPEKQKDPRAPLIKCTIQSLEFNRVFLDTRASIFILSKLIFDRFKLSDLEPIKLEMQLADGSIRAPYGKSEDVIVIVGNLAFPVDFIVTDVKIIGAN